MTQTIESDLFVRLHNGKLLAYSFNSRFDHDIDDITKKYVNISKWTQNNMHTIDSCAYT